jgi:electron transfer flavoprotein alpha subunit
MILVFIEHSGGEATQLSLEALTFGRRVAESSGLPLEAALVGEDARKAAEALGAFGVSTANVAVLDGDFAPAAWAQAVVSLIEEGAPGAVLASGSDRGNEVMAHVAAKTGLPLAANCTEVLGGAGVTPSGTLDVTRMRWGGSLLEEARIEAPVKLITVAPHALSPEEGGGAQVEVREFSPELSEQDTAVRVVERVLADTGKISLPEAAVVVGGGRGVGSAEGFKDLEELAGLLGAALGVSRAVTSLGWRPHSEQIGQTGTRIAPELYIACGISGAIQHMVGCKAAKRILAINTDDEAPIVTKASYAVIGDLHSVVPAISEEIRRRS